MKGPSNRGNHETLQKIVKTENYKDSTIVKNEDNATENCKKSCNARKDSKNTKESRKKQCKKVKNSENSVTLSKIAKNNATTQKIVEKAEIVKHKIMKLCNSTKIVKSRQIYQKIRLLFVLE